MKGPPRFFCDNCGAEVPAGEKRCPYCGRHFASVRCPRCGLTGDDALFREGCPICGYSTPREEPVDPAPPRAGYRKAGGLPLWVYILTAVLVALLAMLFTTVR